jgi:hypothetical protein
MLCSRKTWATGLVFGRSNSANRAADYVIYSCREKVFRAEKLGGLRGPDNSFNGLDPRLLAVKNFAAS